MVIGFPGNRFKGEIVPAIKELEDVLAFGFADIDGEAVGLLNDEDLRLVAETLEPDSSAALIVWSTAGRPGSPWRSGTRAGRSSPASGSPTRSSRAPWPNEPSSVSPA